MSKSKRFKEVASMVEDKTYMPEEAIELAKKTSTTKFTGSIEIHLNLGIDPKQSDQSVRGQVSLPHNIGREVRVVAFVNPEKEAEAKKAGADIVGGEELIKEIKQSGKTDFDMAVAEPAIMQKLAQIAKILGPRGLMPNPRSGTVTDDLKGSIAEIKAGRMDVKNDGTGNVHGILGKADMETKNLLENFNAFYEAVSSAKPAAVKKQYIKTVAVNSTMGPGIKVKMGE